MDPTMGGMGMGGMPPPQGGMDPAMLAALLGGMGGMGGAPMADPMAMGAPPMGGPMGGPQPPVPGMGGFGDDGGLAPGTGGTTPLGLNSQPIPDGAPLSGPDSSVLLQALMGMTQQGVPMSGQSPVGGGY